MKALFWHISMIPSAFAYFWPVTLALLAVVGAGFWLWFKQDTRSSVAAGKLFGTLMFTVAILLLGVFFAAGPNYEQRPSANIVSYVISALVLVQLLVSLYLLKSSPVGTRLLSTGVLLLTLAISVSTWFIASMSISGQWL